MKKILIVDDDRDVFESMKIVLEAEGYGVDWATNGAEAISKARSLKPDLMILDEYLPVSGVLHEELAALAKRSGAGGISAMCSIPEARSLRLASNGYVRTPYKFQFIAKWLANGDAPECLWDARKWHLMWLDADTL